MTVPIYLRVDVLIDTSMEEKRTITIIIGIDVHLTHLVSSSSARPPSQHCLFWSVSELELLMSYPTFLWILSTRRLLPRSHCRFFLQNIRYRRTLFDWPKL